MHTIKAFFRNKESLILFLISIALTANSVFLIIHKLDKNSYKGISDYSSLIAFIYFILSASFVGTIFFFNSTFDFEKILKKVLLVYLPVQALFLYEINAIKMVTCPAGGSLCLLYNNFVPAATVAYFLLLGYFIVLKRKKTSASQKKSSVPKEKNRWLPIAIVGAVFILNISFGLFHLSKTAAVDEALWTFDRIPKYWNNISDGEWQKTRVSDKPGITVSLISGIGLNWVNPEKYEKNNQESGSINPENILKLNFALRFPTLLFCALMIFVFYFFLNKALGKTNAILATILIGLSPILLGISTIINPDSLLWIFVPLSILSYFIYKKEGTNAYLYWAGIFFGLALLTKYVANILYVFFFLLIFLEYIFNKEKYSGSLASYFKKTLLDYATLVFFSLLTFMFFLPASWVESYKLLEGTILSQAFQKIWPLFLGIIAFIILDITLIRGKSMNFLLGIASRYKKILFTAIILIFLFSIFLVIANVYLGMRWSDFESILASPKSSYLNSEFFGLWGANFYSMIFGIMPIALFAVVYLSIKNLRNKLNSEGRIFLYLVIFILLYYFASTINNVSATSRYQIIIYPIVLILSAIEIKQFISIPRIKKYIPEYIAFFILIIFSVYSLNFIRPFYFSYASGLLPKQYVLNLKDMGDGSYEAAQYLNTLPEASMLSIWSDKSGVCTFFLGKCASSVEDVKNGGDFDYFVVSSGRESRTSKMTLARFNGGNDKIIRLDKLYLMEGENLEWKLEIGGRPNNFVKIIKSESLSSQ